MIRNRWSAYFTVEAVLILPIVVWVIGLVVYLMLFQYNRCLMEQDLGMVLLRAGSFTVSSEELAEVAADLCGGVNPDKYLACDRGSISVEKQISGLMVSSELQVNYPLGSWGAVRDVWQAQRSYQCTGQSPVYVIRACNKVKQALENLEDEENENGVH